MTNKEKKIAREALEKLKKDLKRIEDNFHGVETVHILTNAIDSHINKYYTPKLIGTAVRAENGDLWRVVKVGGHIYIEYSNTNGLWTEHPSSSHYAVAIAGIAFAQHEANGTLEEEE